jgi:hypothetical protein
LITWRDSLLTSSTMSIIYDAPNGDDFISPVRLTKSPDKKYPLKTDSTAIEYSIQYIQRADYYIPLALDTICPENQNAYLIQNTDPKPFQNGLVKFTRVFQTVPATRIEMGNNAFLFPAIRSDVDVDGNWTVLRSSFTRRVPSKVTYSYLQTLDPNADLTITERFQITDASSNAVDYLDTTTSPTKATYEGYISGGTYLQASDTVVSRWRGNIWQMQNIQVKAI